MNKNGVMTISVLGGLAIALVVAAVVIAVGAEILDDIQDEVTGAAGFDCDNNGTAAFNATCGGLAGTEVFGEWLDTIALIVVAAVVIGIIVTSFGRGGRM